MTGLPISDLHTDRIANGEARRSCSASRVHLQDASLPFHRDDPLL
jgi:hypothetical protein